MSSQFPDTYKQFCQPILTTSDPPLQTLAFQDQCCKCSALYRSLVRQHLQHRRV